MKQNALACSATTRCAEADGYRGQWCQRAILGRCRWDADAMQDIVRDYALETLADPDA